MSSQGYEGAGEVLLDLGDFRQGRSVLDDEFVLDIDLDESPEPSPAEPAFSATAFRDRESYRSLPKIQPSLCERLRSAGNNLFRTCDNHRHIASDGSV